MRALYRALRKLTKQGLIYNEIEALKKASLSAATSYLDRLKEQTVVKIFNAIVKQSNYQSYFIDELMAYYELHISDALEEKENNCKAIMAEIEKNSRNCINTFGTWSAADNNVLTFKSALKDWDEYAQPLHVNMQRRGGEHGASSNLVYDLRSKIIDMGNDMQSWICSDLEELTRLTNAASNAYSRNYNYYDLIDEMKDLKDEMKSTQNRLVKKIPVGIKIIDISVKLIDILASVFAELEIVAEKLKNDKKDLLELKTTLNKIKGDFDEMEKQQARQKEKQLQEEKNRKVKISLGILAGIAIFAIIIAIIASL